MEEHYSKLRKLLDTQSTSSKNKKLSNHLEAIKTLEQFLYEEQDCNRFTSLLVQCSFNPDSSRIEKLLAYLLIRNFNSTCTLDWNDIVCSLDIDSEDKELQKNALMLINMLPLNESCELLLSMESVFLKYLEGTNANLVKSGELAPQAATPSQDINHSIFHIIEYLPDIMIKIYILTKNEEDSETVLAISALKGLKSLIKSYYYPELYNNNVEDNLISKGDEINNKLDKGSYKNYLKKISEQKSAIRPLMVQMLNCLLSRFPLIIYRIDCMDLSIAASLYEIPALIFKYLYEVNLDYCGVFKFDDCPDPIDYHTFVMDFLNDLANKMLKCTNVSYIHLLLDPLIKLIQINDDKLKPTKMQLESTDIIYKLMNHSLRIM